MPQRPLIILGSGYTARFLLPLALERSPSVFATSRTPERHLGHLPEDQRLRFDLSRPDTWGRLPHDADLIWCFPAMPLDLVREFIESRRGSIGRLVVLGSTSAYDLESDRQYPPPWIDETAPVDLTKPRVQGEEFLRQDCGAVVLRVAGIYGPGRNVLINLLDNARRYASGRAQAIQVSTRTTRAGHVVLGVWSDGQPMEPSVERHMFEPFFSSESRSTGLGLYICRELCEGQGATIGFERTRRTIDGVQVEGNEFLVTMDPGGRDLSGAAASDRIPLAP